MRSVLLALVLVFYARTAAPAANQHVLSNPVLRVVVDLETGAIAEFSDLYAPSSPLIFQPGEKVLSVVAGEFRPVPFSVTEGDLASVTLVSSAFRSQTAQLPLRTTIRYRLAGNRLAVDYCFEALDRVALDNGLDVVISSSVWDTLFVRNHFSGEAPIAFGPSYSVRHLALNQIYELHNSLRTLGLVFPNPYHSLVTVAAPGTRPFRFVWRVLAAVAPIQAIEPKGPPLASVLSPGVQLHRHIDLIVEHDNALSSNTTLPVAYFSPFPNGCDQVIAMTFDDIPFGRYVYPKSGHDSTAPLEQYLVRLLEDHPRMKMGWIILPDALFGPDFLVDPNYPAGKWWRAHGTHRILTVAPASYLQWVRSLDRGSVAYGYENRVHLGSHGYHHTPEMLFGANYEFQSYDPAANDSTFAAIAREFSLLGLGANSLKWIRFPGFYFTRATVDALIKYGFAFFDYWGIYDRLPWMLFYSERGRIWGAGTWWQGDTPSSYDEMDKILRAGKLCHTAGHPGQWFDGDPEVAFQQISGIFQQAEDNFPNLGYLFPDEVGFFAAETYDISAIETELACDAFIFSFTGAAPSGQTIMIEWPGGWPPPAQVTVDGLALSNVEPRGRRLVVVLPALANGEHRLRIPLDECPLTKRGVPPSAFALRQNFPNPFNGGTVIGYDVPADAHVTLSVYNLRGERVAVLVDEERAPGTYSVKWNGRDGAGRNVASGIYFYRLEAGSVSYVRKLALVR